MPEPLGIYLMALLHFTNATSCSAIADAFDRVSHDRLTRMLQGTWSGHILLDLALRALGSVLDVEMATLTSSPKAYRLTNKPMTMSCICVDSRSRSSCGLNV